MLEVKQWRTHSCSTELRAAKLQTTRVKEGK